MRALLPISLFAVLMSALPVRADMVVTRELPDGNRVFFKCIGLCDAAAINARIDRMRLAPGTQDTSVRVVTTDANSVGPVTVQGVSNAVVAVALGQQNRVGRIAVNGTNNLVRVVEQGSNNFAAASSVGANNTANIGIYGANNRVTSAQTGTNMSTSVTTRGNGTTVAASQTDPAYAAPQNASTTYVRGWPGRSNNSAQGASTYPVGLHHPGRRGR
jgi:hypothetical protein